MKKVVQKLDFIERVKDIIKQRDNVSLRDLISELVAAIKDTREQSVFLISYDFKNNNSKVKSELLSSYPQEYQAGLDEKSFPDSTLIWHGSADATLQDAIKLFKRRVEQIIDENDLETEFAKTIVVDIIDSSIIIEDLQ